MVFRDFFPFFIFFTKITDWQLEIPEGLGCGPVAKGNNSLWANEALSCSHLLHLEEQIFDNFFAPPTKLYGESLMNDAKQLKWEKYKCKSWDLLQGQTRDALFTTYFYRDMSRESQASWWAWDEESYKTGLTVTFSNPLEIGVITNFLCISNATLLLLSAKKVFFECCVNWDFYFHFLLERKLTYFLVYYLVIFACNAQSLGISLLF